MGNGYDIWNMEFGESEQVRVTEITGFWLRIRTNGGLLLRQ